MDKSYKKEFEKLLFTALRINPKKNQITLIYDESFFKYLDSFNQIVNEFLLSISYIFIPTSYQYTLQTPMFLSENDEVLLPNGICSAISNSDIILNFLDGKINTSGVRAAILNRKKTFECRVAHCPGLSDEVLGLILKSPYKKILQLSEHTAWALGNSTNVQLVSKNSNGKSFILEIKLDAWENEPIMSSGTVFKGSWGNIPPGETFCCPNPENVNGSICINGSIPGTVLSEGDEIVLHFEKGKLNKWNANANSVSNEFLNNLKSEAEKRNDKNWNTFAELGIGLNPAIKELTGNALFDEKMAGTIHIAIGNNVIFGHDVNSQIHIDMVVLKPKLILNSRIIIENGNINIDEIENWRKTFVYCSLEMTEADRVHFKPSKIKVEGNIIKRRISKGGRISLINLLSNKYVKTLSLIKENLETDQEVSVKHLYSKLTKKQQKEARVILEILNHFKAIEINVMR